MSLRFSFTMIIFALLVVGCSSSKPTPTQDNGVILTQAVETAVASILTSQPTASPTAIPETSTPSSTSTPSITSTPTPPPYEVGITSCENNLHSAYPGWSIYDCGFWVKTTTNQSITFGEFLKKNDETLKNTYFYEQGDYLNPIDNNGLGVSVSTTENILYQIDFIFDPLSEPEFDTYTMIPSIPFHGVANMNKKSISLHFLIPDTMTPDFIYFPKIGVQVSVPQSGIKQSVPTPERDVINTFDYIVDNEKIELSFKEFDVRDDFGIVYFLIIFDVVNKDKASQVSSEVSFPYFFADSDGMYYPSVKSIKIDLGPGQKDEYVIERIISWHTPTTPQYMYLIPENPNEPIIIVDTNSPQSSPIATADTTSGTASGNPQCGNFASQLQSNIEAKVITDAINVREKHGTTQTIVGVIYQGDKVKILNESSVCSEGFLWWKVQTTNGVIGWAVEGTAEERWLSP